MAVKIRLQRVGKKNQPLYRIIAIDENKKLKGKPLEVLGSYNPIKKELKLDSKKYEEWLKRGSIASDTVKSLYKKVIKKEKVTSEIISAITSKK